MAAGGFARLMHREPIVVWSVGIGTVGLLMPLVVPALRDMFGFGALDVRPLPKPLEVAAGEFIACGLLLHFLAVNYVG